MAKHEIPILLRAMLDQAHPVLSIRGQCRLLGLARSGVYQPPPLDDAADLALMRNRPAGAAGC
jgi:hypothetical protein